MYQGRRYPPEIILFVQRLALNALLHECVRYGTTLNMGISLIDRQTKFPFAAEMVTT
jgi:hypothetical protein